MQANKNKINLSRFTEAKAAQSSSYFSFITVHYHFVFMIVVVKVKSLNPDNCFWMFRLS